MKIYSCSLFSCHSLSRSIHLYEISAFASKIPMMMLNNCEKNSYVFLVPPLTNFFPFPIPDLSFLSSSYPYINKKF